MLVVNVTVHIVHLVGGLLLLQLCVLKSSEFGLNFRLLQFIVSIFWNHPSTRGLLEGIVLRRIFPVFSFLLHSCPVCCALWSHYV
jgi:hypothetical protein